MAQDLVNEGVRVWQLLLVGQRGDPAAADNSVDLLLNSLLDCGEVDAVHEKVREVGARGLGASQEQVEHSIEVVPVACIVVINQIVSIPASMSLRANM